jgi:hypothetical protein
VATERASRDERDEPVPNQKARSSRRNSNKIILLTANVTNVTQKYVSGSIGAFLLYAQSLARVRTPLRLSASRSSRNRVTFVGACNCAVTNRFFVRHSFVTGSARLTVLACLTG